MITIREASIPEDDSAVYELFAEYLRWICPRIDDEYQIRFDAESILTYDLSHLSIFAPPQGLLLLAHDSGSLAGCAGFRALEPTVAELKRMYVRPDFRRKGVGRMLVAETLRTARQRGFALMRLDSAGFMRDAHALYRGCGFEERPPYEGSEVPDEHSRHWRYMEFDLSRGRIE